MEHKDINSRLKIKNRIQTPFGGVRFTGGRLKTAFDNQISFLKRFDLDRMMYWYRDNAGEDAPGAPYGFHGGHFENNLHGQTAGQFLWGAGCALIWQEDAVLRERLNAVIDELERLCPENGCLIPMKDEDIPTKEYPNYTRAWILFGLLSAGYAGNEKAFKLARRFGDWFNHCECLEYVKDLNLGFQGILANTALYVSPVGVEEDLEVAQKYYREDYWLKWVHNGEHRAVYQHPGNHPHGTLLTSLEGYLDIYRATGEEYLLECIVSALKMYKDKWQHVGGGIVMCEFDNFYPGCNFLSPNHAYNELCITTFWMMLNYRMHLLYPDNEDYINEIEKSMYNVLIAAQVDDIGIHYLALLEGCKDLRYADIATCCAATGGRMLAMLPMFMYSYDKDIVSVNMFGHTKADLPNGVSLNTISDMPYDGKVRIEIEKADAPFTLKIRIPAWCKCDVKIGENTYKAGTFAVIEGVNAGDIFEFTLPFSFRTTLLTGAEVIPGKDRYAIEYGPLLLAALGRGGVKVNIDINDVASCLKPVGKGVFRVTSDRSKTYMPYMDIVDEPLTVYPIINDNEIG